MDDPTDLYKTTGLVIRQVYQSALIFTSVRTSGLVGSSTPGYSTISGKLDMKLVQMVWHVKVDDSVFGKLL